MSALVLSEQREGLLWITLNRPEKRNAINFDLWAQLDAAVRQAAVTEGVRAVLLQGAGPSFSSGIDVTNFMLLAQKYGEGWRQRMRTITADFQAVLNRLERLELPTIALLHGHCLGLALELALACDIRLAAEGTRLGLPETRLGMIPDVGGTTRLTRLVGPARAKELIFTGREIDAAQAAGWGLVNHVVPAGALVERGEALGAEVSVCLGEEQETYTFDEPTAVVIPPGLPHGPIRTERVYSPRGFGCWSVQLDGAPGITPMGAGVPEVSARQRQAAPEGMRFAEAGGILKNGPAPPSGKYARLVEPLKSFILVERGHVNPSRLARIHPAAPPPDPPAGDRPGPGSADHMAWITGGDLEGFGATVVWGFCSRPGISRRGVGAHVHPAGEVLVYLGMDPRDPEALGAELEIDLGPEHERHLVTASSAVVCPAGVPHMPQLTRWVDRPFGFFAVCLDGGHRTDAVD